MEKVNIYNALTSFRSSWRDLQRPESMLFFKQVGGSAGVAFRRKASPIHVNKRGYAAFASIVVEQLATRS